ncbi:WxL protein peptidoglycan domain-containing protein [Embleya sp. NPDC020886]|uniref:WxL protein peptidoglycan domain-containing protein n=1 Tax=Embleya sp. NPDC020886 TaxID=3363980 RepID=UPI00379614E7
MTGTPAPPSRRQGGRNRSLATLFAVLATLFASLTLVAPTPASAAGNGEWSVDPFVPDGTSQNARRYFFLEGAAGTTVPDVVTVHNTSPAPLTMKLFGADAYNTPRDGGFALRTVTDKQKDVGTWIQVAPENQTLTLQPGEKRQVPFNIVIPPNATPGDHPGAIVALNTAIEGTQQQGQIKVNIQRQIGARVYLRVQGDALPAMDIQKVEVKRDAGFHEFFGSSKAKVTYRIINRGNVILRPKFELKAEGLFGRKLMSKVDEGTEILPGSAVEKVVEWKDAPRLDHVTVKVNGVVADQNIKDDASASYTAVPWPSLLTLAALLLVAGIGWGVWRNGRKGKGGDPAKPAGPVGPTDDTTVLPPVPAAPAPAGAEHAQAAGESAPVAEPAPAEPAKAAVSAETSGAAAVADAEAAEKAEVETPAEDTSKDAESGDKGERAETADKSAETEEKPAEVAASDDEQVDDKQADAEATPVADKPVAETPADASAAPETAATEPAEPEAASATPAAEQPAAAVPAADAEPEPDAEPAVPAAAPAKKAAKRPKGKQPPARPRADAPAAEDSADSAGVGR